MKTLTTLFLTLFSLTTLADLSPTSQQEIQHLKQYITLSKCVFTRNGTDYKGSKAISHIERKEDYFKDEITSAEDFIRLAATKSEMSGSKYTVSCVEGKTAFLGEWFLEELTNYRALGR